MENAGRPKQISKEEYLRIMALPERKFRLGGGIRTGRYDEAAHRFYETTVDEDGKEVLTGRTASVTPPPAASQPSSDSENEEDGQPDGDEEAEDEDSEAAPGFFARFKWPLIITGVMVVVAVCAIAFMGGSTPNLPSPDGTASNAPSTEVSVIRVNKDLLPGHVLTPEDVEEVQLARAEYEEVSLFGRNLYTYDNLDKLVGNYMTKFVPAGQYLEQDTVQAASPFAINPWTITDANSTLVKVPLDDILAENVGFGFGSVVDLTVRRVTANQVAVGGEGETVAVPGVTHTSTVGTTSTTEEFTIGSLVVCDLLNADGDSIYESYCAYIGIPLGQRLDYLSNALVDDAGLADKLYPVYAMVRVTGEQAMAIGDVSASNTTAAIKFNGETSQLTNEQFQFSSEAQAVKTTIYQAQALNEQRAAEEQAEMEKTYEESKHQQDQEGKVGDENG